MKLTVLGAALGVSLVVSSFAASRARADEDSAAYRANVGLRIGIAPVLLIPTEGGPLGGGLELDARYGIPVGPVIIAPGGRLAGYYDDSHFIGIAMPTARVTFPLGPLAPFLVGGIGPGLVTNPSEGGGRHSRRRRLDGPCGRPLRHRRRGHVPDDHVHPASTSWPSAPPSFSASDRNSPRHSRSSARGSPAPACYG